MKRSARVWSDFAQLSQKKECLHIDRCPFLLGDQVDETVEHHTGLHTLGGGRHKRILDASHGSIRTEFGHRVIVLHAHIGADDVLLRVTTRGRMHNGEPVVLERFDLLVRVVRLGVGLRNAHTVLVLTVLREQVSQVVHGLATVQEETNRIAPGAITEHLKQSVRASPDLVGLARDRIGQELAAVHTTAVRERTGGVAIREEHGVNDLQPIVLAELGHDLHRSNNRLVKRRAAQTQATRQSVVVSTIVLRRCDCEQILHRLLELIRAHLGREEVQQTEHMELRVLVLVLRVPLLGIHGGFVVIQLGEIFLDHTTSERIDLERNVATTAEQSDLHELLDGIKQSRPHRTRPVDEHDESVVLTFTHNRVAAEDVVGDLVVHHANGVKHTRLGDRGALRSIGGLAEIELLRHQRNHGRRISSELLVLLLRIAEQLVVHIHRRVDKSGAVIRQNLLNLRVGDDDVVRVAGRQIEVLILRTTLVGHLLDCFVKLLLRGGCRSGRVVLHLVSTLAGRRTRGLRSLLVLLVVAIGALTGTLLVAVRRIVRLTGVRIGAVRCIAVVLIVAATHGDLRGFAVLASVSIALFALGGRFLLLLLCFLLEARLVLPNVADDALHIVKGTASVDALDERLLNGRELNTRVHASTHLVLKVDAVDERQLVDVAALDTEEVIGDELLIRLVEVAAHTGELLLHQLLDAGVLHDVHVDLSDFGVRRTGDLFRSTTPRALHLVIRIAVRREQRVTDFVTNEHIVDLVGHPRPCGKNQDAVLGVERGRAGLGIVLHGDVLAGENARQQILAGGVDGAGGRGNGGNSLHRLTLYQNPVKPASLESIFSKSLWDKDLRTKAGATSYNYYHHVR